MKKNLKYYMNLNYPIEVKKIGDKEGYIASIPSLGKYAFQADGESIKEAIENLEAVKEFLFKEYLKNGIVIPEPEEEHQHKYSGKFVIRIPKQLHRILAESAKKENLSLNQYVQFLLTSAAVAHSFENVIESYNRKFDRMLKDYSDSQHNYFVLEYGKQHAKSKLKLISTKNYSEAV